MEKGYLGIRKEITFLIKYAGRSHRIYKENSLAGVMFNVFVSSTIDRGFWQRSGQDYTVVVWYFSVK